MQIAFSGAIRVGDVVQLEDGQWWGRIEEITLSYVVVRLWDERRLVLPCTYFTTEPFENWTRSATEIMGTVEFDVDFSVPFDEMRAELDRLLADERALGWPSRGAAGDRRRRRCGPGADRGERPERGCAIRPALCGARGHGQLGATQRGVLPTQRIEAAETVTEAQPRAATKIGGRSAWRQASSPAAPRPRRGRERSTTPSSPKTTSSALTAAAERAPAAIDDHDVAGLLESRFRRNYQSSAHRTNARRTHSSSRSAATSSGMSMLV